MRLDWLAAISVLAVVMAVFTPHVLRTESTWQAAAYLVNSPALPRSSAQSCCSAASNDSRTAMPPRSDPPARIPCPGSGSSGPPSKWRTRVRLQTDLVQQERRERDRRFVGSGGLLVSGGDPAEALEPVEAALDHVAPPVGLLVESWRSAAVATAPQARRWSVFSGMVWAMPRFRR